MKQRTHNTLIKRIVDICMTVLLLCLMSYQVMGEALHEWIGIGMTIVLMIHHLLNAKWYTALFKGKYNVYQIITTVINTLLLVSIVLTAFCGMSMSNHAIPFLYGMTDMIFARTAHLALSYWSFILMGLHLGLHLPVMTANIKPNHVWKAAFTVIFTTMAGIGLWLFIKNGIPGYLAFTTHFAFFDYDKAAALVFLENLTIEFFFVFVGANIVRFIRHLNSKSQEKKNLLTPVVCVLVAVIIGLILSSLSPRDKGTSGWEVSNGGGCFGQSLTAIVKPAHGASHGEGLAINYSEGAKMSEDVSDWLEENGMNGKQKKAVL